MCCQDPSRFLALARARAHTHTHTLSLSLARAHTHTNRQTHTDTHTQTHTQRPSLHATVNGGPQIFSSFPPFYTSERGDGERSARRLFTFEILTVHFRNFEILTVHFRKFL